MGKNGLVFSGHLSWLYIDESRSLILTLVFVFMSVTVIWVGSTGNPINYFYRDVPPGQGLYVLSKLSGLYAMALMSLQISIGLLPSLGWKKFHKSMGMLLSCFIVIHISLFIAASSLRSGAFSYDSLLPSFNTGFYNQALSLGVIGFVFLAIVVFSGVNHAKKSIGWLWVHRMSIVLYVLVFLHSYLIGSETHTIAIRGFYVITAIIIASSSAKQVGQIFSR